MIVTFHKQKTLLAPKTVNHWIKLVFNKFSTFNWVLFGVISELSIGDLISRGEGKTNIRNIQMENWFKMKNTITVKHGRKITIEELLNVNSCIDRKICCYSLYGELCVLICSWSYGPHLIFSYPHITVHLLLVRKWKN